MADPVARGALTALPSFAARSRASMAAATRAGSRERALRCFAGRFRDRILYQPA